MTDVTKLLKEFEDTIRTMNREELDQFLKNNGLIVEEKKSKTESKSKMDRQIKELLKKFEDDINACDTAEELDAYLERNGIIVEQETKSL